MTLVREAPLFDDQDVLNFIFRPHTISMLLCALALILYTAFGTHLDASAAHSSSANVFRGLLAAGSVFLLFAALQFPDGLLTRPHKVVWRVVTGVTVLYLTVLVFLLFLTAGEARSLMRQLDASLGTPLAEKSYAADCRLYTPENPRGAFVNFTDALFEIFTLAHFLGWIGKAIILRDFYLTWTYSVFFEVLEITFAYQLDNFAECWFDQIILDILLANGLGIWVGLRVCKYLEMHYDWVGVRQYRTLRGKAGRVAKQLMPVEFEHYNWGILTDWKRAIWFVLAIVLMSAVELNAFYLKTALWLPPPHPIVVSRLVLWWAIALPGMREYYQFVSDRNEKKLGTMAWLSIAVVSVETMVAYKFGSDMWRDKTMPSHVKKAWLSVLLVVGVAAVWHYRRVGRSP